MNSVLVLPAGSLVDAALSLVRETVDKPIVDHSLRSFFFARLTAQQEGLLAEAAYDEELLFAATVMHDLGLGTLAAGRARFEVEGADLAAGLLAGHGVPDGDIGRVWEAIALHSSVGLADRMALLTYLTHKASITGLAASLGPSDRTCKEKRHDPGRRADRPQGLSDDQARRAEITPTPLQATGTPAPRAAIAQATSYLRSALTS